MRLNTNFDVKRCLRGLEHIPMWNMKNGLFGEKERISLEIQKKQSEFLRRFVKISLFSWTETLKSLQRWRLL